MLNQDFKESVELLNANQVGYLVVGRFLPAALLVTASLLLLFGLYACRPAPPPDPPIECRPGRLLAAQDLFGAFYTYLPVSAPPAPEILVLVHGTPKDGSSEQIAGELVSSWVDFAEQRGILLIAPAFNQEDFSSLLGDRALGGYRGLFGRQIGADAWVLRLVRAHQAAFRSADEPFYLYGHSAGGQFTARFLVAHPESVKRAVITSAATYPQPDSEIPWPFGMGELHADVAWDDGTVTRADVAPDKGSWLGATQVPLTVIVGLNDTAELPASLIPGQKGKNRFTIGRNWVQDMAAFAQADGLESRFAFELIPGLGHTMIGLLPYSQQALAGDPATN